MHINNREVIKKILKRINYMAYEINLYIGKTILDNGFSNQYANKYAINRTNLNIEFFLYNINTQTTSCKSISLKKFLEMCSDKNILQTTAYNIAEQLLEACDKPSGSIVYIK